MSYSWEELEAIYEKVLKIEPANRATFIHETCGDNVALRDDLLDMIRQADEADEFFMDLQENVANSFIDTQTRSFSHGTRIGKYSITDDLGHGGMGTVYLAERADGQFEQKVAIKVYSHLKWSEQMEKSFKQEQQILATLNHPNIAQIYDGGFTEDGTAYFVMEYIDGLPIDQFVRQHHFNSKKRLTLFKHVCGALEYAHRNFILHQDIKPNNILVTKEGHIKLLDFGIASVLGENDSDTSRSKNIIATPYYASPEQWKGEKVNAASDIYQLGILLYKVLVDERDDDSSNRNNSTQVSSGTMPPFFAKLGEEIKAESGLSDDVKAIALKALNKNPSERYQSASELLRDIECYENHFPVIASGKGKVYRLGKYIKRNKLAVISLSAIILILLATSFISMWQANIAKRERNKAEQVADFLKDIFNANDPYEQENELTADELLERGAEKIDNEELSPQNKAEFLVLIGDLFTKLGHWKKASPYFYDAYDIIKKNDINDRLLLVRTLSDLAGVYRDKSEYKKSDSLFLLTQQTIIQSGDLENADHYLAIAFKDQAKVKYFMGQYDSAMHLINKSIVTIPHITKKDSTEMSPIYDVKASILRSLSKYDSAKIFEQKALDIAEKYNDMAMLNICYNNMGIICQKLGDYELSEEYYEKTLNLKSEELDPDHPFIATTLTNIGGTYYKMEKYKKADSVYKKALAILLKQFDNDHNYVVSTRYNMANVALNLNHFGDALHQYQEVLKVDTASLGTDHPYIAGDYACIGKCFTFLGDFRKAKSAFDEAMRIYKLNFDSTHQKISYAYSLYGTLYHEQKQYNRAANYFYKAYNHARNNLGKDHPYTKEYYQMWQQNKKRSPD